MGQLAYLGVLAFVFLGTLWLEFALRTRVYRRWRRLALAVLPAAVIFVVWDLYAIAAEHWDFDGRRLIGVVFAGGLPLEELLFFLVIPVAGVLTLEAVRSATGWGVGDGADDSVAGQDQQS
ncbi:MAG: lycopene cyclase domain-containing protein [Candidatus Nanopelagicales bacterium]